MSNFKSNEKPIPEKNEKGHYYITEKYCCALSEYNGYHYHAEFIANLHLHYKGFTKIENLNAFVNVRVVYLENNCILKIENLSHMKQLSCLYLQNNFISKIENLDENINLSILNLTGNRISVVENLGKLEKLGNLYLEKNVMENPAALRGIVECPSISVLDIQNNYIDNDYEELISIFNKMPYLKVLYLKGNPVNRSIPYYRKTMIKQIENLSYLDDRPVDQGDRLATEAFFTGGAEAERKAREDFRKNKDIGFKVRENEKEFLKKSFEERRNQALQSLKTEYIGRKDQLEKKKKKLLQDLEENPDKKNQITRDLMSVDYQITENEKFKISEENDLISTMSKREKVDRYAIFEFEEWMAPIFETHIVENLFDFSRAVKLIKIDLKNRNVVNWELFNELDLRTKWTEIELQKFRKDDEHVEYRQYPTQILNNSGKNEIDDAKKEHKQKMSFKIQEETINEQDYSEFKPLVNTEASIKVEKQNKKNDLTNRIIENADNSDIFGEGNTEKGERYNKQKNNVKKNIIFEEEEIITTNVPNYKSTLFGELD